MLFVCIAALGVVLVEGVRFGKRECGFGFYILHVSSLFSEFSYVSATRWRRTQTFSVTVTDERVPSSAHLMKWPNCAAAVAFVVWRIHQFVPASLLKTDSTLNIKALNVAAKYPLQ